MALQSLSGGTGSSRIPARFSPPDALHQWHQFFWDHPMKWAKKLLKPAEIDKRYTCLQRRVGERHFRAGFLHLTQITGREKRDLTKHFIGVLPVTPSITPAGHGLPARTDRLFFTSLNTKATTQRPSNTSTTPWQPSTTTRNS